MDQRKRRRLIQKNLSSSVKAMGFIHHSGEYFVRNRGKLQDIFFFQQTRNNNKFYITYGIDCPELLPELRNNSLLSLDGRPQIIISNFRLEDGHAYNCFQEDYIEKSALKVASALSTEAENWFSQFSTAEDIIEHYMVTEVGIDSPSTELPPGKILRWCNYGLMLNDIGDVRGQNWLRPVLSAYKSIPKKSVQDNEWIRIIESSHP